MADRAMRTAPSPPPRPSAGTPRPESEAGAGRATTPSARPRPPGPDAEPEAREAVRVAGRGGEPLPAEARDFFGPRFGHDFSGVRVHADGEAAAAARGVRARAYTVGGDIVFGAGAYAPATAEGRRLLAHELAHVVQHGRGPAPSAPAVRRQSVPSQARLSFEAAVREERWADAYTVFNGLSMGEMTEALDGLPVSKRNALLRERNSAAVRALSLNWPRIDYAIGVVTQGTLPAPVGDLGATGQVAAAADFISARLDAHMPGGAADVSVILQACRDAGITDPSHVAYVLATARLETQEFTRLFERDTRENFIRRYDGVNGNVRGTDDGFTFRGRGYVQITGRGNYRRVGAVVGLDLENNPDLAAERANAARILAVGMRDGLFRGPRLADFDTPQGFNFRGARAIVNAGGDRADDIRNLARGYRRAMPARTTDEGAD